MLVLLFVLAALGLSEVSGGRIHGGVDAPAGFAPHMVALLYEALRLRVVCGGSIITDRHVLTAAHCVTTFLVNRKLHPSFFGRVGSNIWHSGGTLVYFESHNIHPEWDEAILKNDLAVLSLTEDLVFGTKVAPIRLEFGWVDGDQASYVTGWGTTWPYIGDDFVNLAPTPELLQLLYLSTMCPWQCIKVIQESAEWAAVAPPLDQLLEICTFHSLGTGMCNGDSGSGLVQLRTRRQIGVISWGFPCARGAPDMSVRLSAFEDFITNAVTGKRLL